MNHNFKHCPVQSSLHDFLSCKVRFIYTSTVTGSDFCSGKNYAYAWCTSCYVSLKNSPKHFMELLPVAHTDWFTNSQGIAP